MIDRDKYQTDRWVTNMLHTYYDPCPIDYDGDIDESGLQKDWFIQSMPYDFRIFVNPPYSNVTPWVERAIEAYQENCKVYMLMKCDTSTKWFAMLHEAGAKFIFMNGRLRFSTGKTAPFPSMLVVLDRDSHL